MLKPNEIFKIEPTKIHAKFAVSTSINLKDYNDKSIIETSTALNLPGILEFYCPEFDDYCQLVIKYNINLLKTQNVSLDGHNKTFHYVKNELVIENTYYSDDVDISSLIRMLQGRLKYIKDPKILVNMMHESLSSVDLVHLELIVSNMFRQEADTSKKCRMTGNYKDSIIVGQDKQPMLDSWKSSIAFQKIDQAINIGLIQNKPAQNNPIEMVLNENFKGLK